jgi:hypothetical protein
MRSLQESLMGRFEARRLSGTPFDIQREASDIGFPIEEIEEAAQAAVLMLPTGGGELPPDAQWGARAGFFLARNVQ